MSINIVYSNALENWSIEKAQEIVEESFDKWEEISLKKMVV
ncbi:hypothetical protein [Candidatus Tisiphia endosymbiont of Micropterix aruncella]